MKLQLRRLSVRLETSGTATLIENTKLYKGSYAFVEFRAYVPVTQNRTPDTMPMTQGNTVEKSAKKQRSYIGQVDKEIFSKTLYG